MYLPAVSALSNLVRVASRRSLRAVPCAPCWESLRAPRAPSSQHQHVALDASLAAAEQPVLGQPAHALRRPAARPARAAHPRSGQRRRRWRPHAVPGASAFTHDARCTPCLPARRGTHPPPSTATLHRRPAPSPSTAALHRRPQHSAFALPSAVPPAPLVLADPLEATGPLLNAAELAGAVALIRRGGCSFEEKLRRASECNAAAVRAADLTLALPLTLPLALTLTLTLSLALTLALTLTPALSLALSPGPSLNPHPHPNPRCTSWRPRVRSCCARWTRARVRDRVRLGQVDEGEELVS